MQGIRALSTLSNDRRRSHKWYSIQWGHDGHVYKTNICAFIHSFYSHCHDVEFSWSIKFSVVYFFFCTDWMAICSMHTDSALGIRKVNSTVACRSIEKFCRAPLVCGGKAKTARKFFLTMRLIWHSIDEPEWKVELDFDNFSGRNWCSDAICLIIYHYFTLGWKWRFFRLNDTTRNACSTDSFN